MLKLTKEVFLASSSPRRHQLLTALNIDFIPIKVDFDESYPAELSPEEVPTFICKQKAEQLPIPTKNQLYITADTIVVCDGKVLEKPKSKAEAVKMLQTLSNNTHKVITSVCLKWLEDELILSDHTLVTFYPLSSTEIEYYVEEYVPLDKAGAYGIQEWIGLIGIKEIQGNYDNVVGFPASKFYQELKKLHLLQ